ncbi:MAG: hypothetical protein ACI9LY_003155 [Arenicella sp.]|jgi:hypothetical protein
MRLPTSQSRRRFLVAGAVAGTALYVNQRGLRYPRMGFEHRPPAKQFDSVSALVTLEHAIFVEQKTDPQLKLRAIAPEPLIELSAKLQGKLTIDLNNVAPSAILHVSGDTAVSVHESIEGINRQLEIDLMPGQSINLSWKLAQQDGAQFAVIGDSGAGKELEWILHRAENLGAQFLLHLGDFNYVEGEYDRAIELFNKAPFPCYVSIGNHDYNDSGLIYQQFINEVGPMNHSFNIAGTRFANIDSAADFFPASSGQRGFLFDRLLEDNTQYTDQVFFTHRPFYDVREGEDHVIGGLGEIRWLKQQIKQSGCDNLLTGHVHHSAETDLDGLRQWTVGEGLGFEDILKKTQVAQLLMGTVEQGRKVAYQWAALEMPWLSHLSPTHEIKLKRDHSPAKLEWYRAKLEQELGAA